MNKIGFLSLEFLSKDQSYWMITGCGFPDFSFIEIPTMLFGRSMLCAQGISDCKDYSEITVIQNDNKDIVYQFKDTQESDMTEIYLNLKNFHVFSWNEMFQFLIKEGIKLKELTGFYHYNLIKKKDNSDLKINDVIYKVTAFLPEQGVFAIMGEDYNPPLNINWITFSDYSEDNKFKILVDNFIITYVSLGGNKYYAV